MRKPGRLLITVGEQEASAGLCADSWQEVLDKALRRDFATHVGVCQDPQWNHFLIHLRGMDRSSIAVCQVTGIWWVIPDVHSPWFHPDRAKAFAEAVLVAGMLGDFVRHFKPYG